MFVVTIEIFCIMFGLKLLPLCIEYYTPPLRFILITFLSVVWNKNLNYLFPYRLSLIIISVMNKKRYVNLKEFSLGTNTLDKKPNPLIGLNLRNVILVFFVTYSFNVYRKNENKYSSISVLYTCQLCYKISYGICIKTAFGFTDIKIKTSKLFNKAISSTPSRFCIVMNNGAFH